MRVSQFLDDLEQSPAYLMMPPNLRPDRRGLLRLMSAELNELSAKLPDTDFFQTWMEPAIRTRTGDREYDLPDDFPDNFVRLDRERWACNLDDGSAESNLQYRQLTAYYDQNLRGQTNGRPQFYSIVLRPDGRRQLLVSPPPDANGSVGYYEIDGLYCPTDWILSDEDQLPPLPANHSVLRWGVSRRLSADLEPRFQEAYAVLITQVTRNRNVGIAPKLGNYRNQYTLMRRP